MSSDFLDSLFGSSVQQRLQVAKRIFTAHGEQLLSFGDLQGMLSSLGHLQAVVSRCMEESGMPAFCTNCAARSYTGGCCSLAMTNENDAVLLLLNLLAGEKVELLRNDENECLFLGPTGCSLRFKPFFCLNYICRSLQLQIEPELNRKLQRATGLLLQEQFAAEQFLLGKLRFFCGEESRPGSREPAAT